MTFFRSLMLCGVMSPRSILALEWLEATDVDDSAGLESSGMAINTVLTHKVLFTALDFEWPVKDVPLCMFLTFLSRD